MKQHRRLSIILGAVVVAVLAGAVVLRHNSAPLPNIVAIRMQEHEERGQARGFVPKLPALPASSKVPVEMANPADFPLWNPIKAAFVDPRICLDVAKLDASAGAHDEATLEDVREAIRWNDAFARRPDHIVRTPTDGEWAGAGPAVDVMLAHPPAVEAWPWAAAWAYCHGDNDTGDRLAMQIAQRGEGSAFYFRSITGQIDRARLDGGVAPTLLPGESYGDALRLLLILDAADAPRPAFEGVLKALLDRLPDAEKREWLREGRSLACVSNLRLIYDVPASSSTPVFIYSYAKFQWWQPVLFRRTRDFIEAWNKRDGARLAEAEMALKSVAAHLTAQELPLPTSAVYEYHLTPWPAPVWQYASDCMARDRRPAADQMALFVAAAMLFRRDTGNWPATAEVLTPAYLPAGVLGDGAWGVVELDEFTYNRDELDATWDKALDAARASVYFQLPGVPAGDTALPPAPAPAPVATARARPLFYHVGPADPCSIAARTRLFGDLRLSPKLENVETAAKLLAGQEVWTELSLVGFSVVPPEALLRLLRRSEAR